MPEELHSGRRACDPEVCNKECSNHGVAQYTLAQHTESIKAIELAGDNVQNRLSALEAKFGTFTWICGTGLTILIALSIAALVQLQTFERKYYEDQLKDRDRHESQSKTGVRE